MKIPGSFYSIELVALVLKMVIQGAISMRAAARVSGLLCEFLGGHRLDGLSHTTVQNYLLRAGMHQITYATESSNNRIWIMDHMIAAGSLKCLVVLGIDADTFATLDHPLQHHDVDVLSLIPTDVSNGTIVNQQLTELAKRCGVPRAILSDCGSDLKKGVELFQQTNSQTIALFDIVHLVCRLIGKRLGKQDRFSKYRQDSYACANKLRQSPLAHVKPPRPKTKARYMNLAPEIRWGRRALWLFDRVKSGDLTQRQRERLDPQAIQDQLGWLEEYRSDLEVWSDLSALGQECCSVVRHCGYSKVTTQKLKETLGTGNSAAAAELIGELIEVVDQQCLRCGETGVRMPGSSEVIESLIGKGKRLLGTSQNNNNLTGQILSIAASTVDLSVATLRESLDRCRIKDLRSWIKDNIAAGIHLARSEDLQEPTSGTNAAQVKSVAIPNF